MITSIELLNFQSHQHTVLEFGKFTVLTGGSNSGKSAVLRALAGVLRNDSVADYVTHGEKELTVIVHMDSGDSVTWNKGSGKNNYTIKYANGTHQDFHKVGADVPEEVSKVLGAGPIAMEGGGRLHINLHEQLEPPFLVGKEHTPGYAAKIFGEITSAAKLQAAVAEGNKMLRSDAATLRTRKKDLEEYHERAQGFATLDLDKESLDRAKIECRKAEDLGKVIEEFSTQIKFLEDSAKAIEGKEKIVASTKSATELSLSSLIELAQASEGLSSVVEEISMIEKKVAALKKWLPKLKAASETDSLAKLAAVSAPMGHFAGIIEDVSKIDKDLVTLQSSKDDHEKKIAGTKEELWQVFDSLDFCPTCNKAVDEEVHMNWESLV